MPVGSIRSAPSHAPAHAHFSAGGRGYPVEFLHLFAHKLPVTAAVDRSAKAATLALGCDVHVSAFRAPKKALAEQLHDKTKLQNLVHDSLFQSMSKADWKSWDPSYAQWQPKL